MAVTLTVNGVAFAYPETGDEDWGSSATTWAQAVTLGMLQKAGGAFTLTADVDFGASFGLASIYYKSRTANLASAGQVRLAVTDAIKWRNNANGGDLTLAVNGSDQLTFNGSVVKAGLIVNADIDAAAAIAFSKMAALTVSRAVVTDGSGVIGISTALSTEVAFLSGVTSAIQTQLNARVLKAGDTMTGFLTLNADPTQALHAATKQYVDALATGINAKTAVRVATTTNGTLSTAFANGQTIDGITLATNDRILIKNQSTQADNGIYVVQGAGAPVRSTDADAWSELVGAFVFVTAGTANASTSWVCNVAAGGTIGVTAVTFVQFGAAGTYTADGQGIILTGSQFSLQINGSTLSQSGSGVKVASGGVTNTEVNASAAIALTKLAALSSHSRALASDSSGFIVESSVTSTELGYVSGVTSAIQTQFGAKISNTLLSSTNDMIYASSANTPARLAAGTSGYILQSASGVPTWTNPQTSYSMFQNATAPPSILAIGTTFASPSFGASTAVGTGTLVTQSSNSLTFPFTGYWEIIFTLNDVTSSVTRLVSTRFRDTTAASDIDSKGGCCVATSAGAGMCFRLFGNITNVGHTYEVQICADGSGVQANSNTVGSLATGVWRMTFRFINI